MNVSPLRILVVLPLYGGSEPIGRYCAEALKKLGHSVRVFDAPALLDGYKGIKKIDVTPNRSERLINSFLRLVSQAAWTQAEEQNSQIVLALAQAPLSRATLAKMRQAGMKTAMWFVEDYRVFDYWRAYAPLYDAFAVIQKEPFLGELRKIGQEHSFYLPLAALPEFHAPLKLSPAEKKEYGADISFLGSGYPNRRVAFRPLAGKNFKIWGTEWDGENVLKDHVQRNGARITAEESVKIYNASKINLNLHSNLDGNLLISRGDFVNPRTFELAAMGAFQLTDKRELMPELFDPDEIATFETIDEFYECIERFLRDPEAREKYARKARERVLRDHTYERRMETFVDYMVKSFAIKSEISGDAIETGDPEFERDLRDLREKLGLAPNAAFADVVATLRRKSGELTELEAAILFLDEWRKHYGVK